VCEYKPTPFKTCRHTPIQTLEKKRPKENCCYCCGKCILAINSLMILEQDPAAYGFTCDLKEVSRKTQAYFSGQVPSWIGWNFASNQEAVKLMEKVPTDLEWMLDFDLSKHVKYSRWRGKTKVNWAEFKDLEVQKSA